MSRSTPNYTDKIFIKTAWHKKLYKLGVPRIFWDDNLIEQIGFTQVPFQGEKFNSGLQRNWVKTLTKETRRNNPLIVISSEPTDTGALVVGYHILFSLLKKRYSTAIFNLGETFKWSRTYPFCVLLHNLLATAPPDRTTTARDLCLRFQYSLRLVIVSGAHDPETWCRAKLGLNPTLVFKPKDISI